MQPFPGAASPGWRSASRWPAILVPALEAFKTRSLRYRDPDRPVVFHGVAFASGAEPYDFPSPAHQDAFIEGVSMALRGILPSASRVTRQPTRGWRSERVYADHAACWSGTRLSTRRLNVAPRSDNLGSECPLLAVSRGAGDESRLTNGRGP